MSSKPNGEIYTTVTGCFFSCTQHPARPFAAFVLLAHHNFYATPRRHFCVASAGAFFRMPQRVISLAHNRHRDVVRGRQFVLEIFSPKIFAPGRSAPNAVIISVLTSHPTIGLKSKEDIRLLEPDGEEARP